MYLDALSNPPLPSWTRYGSDTVAPADGSVRVPLPQGVVRLHPENIGINATPTTTKTRLKCLATGPTDLRFESKELVLIGGHAGHSANTGHQGLKLGVSEPSIWPR
jgi:hypothetical protein